MGIAIPAATMRTAHRFANGDEFLASLGGVALSRIIWDPWPGTATEADLLHLVEVEKRLCELIDGVLLEKPVGVQESLLAGVMMQHLRNWNDAHGDGFVFVGEAGTLRMATVDRIRLPDVGAIARSRLPGGKLPRGVAVPAVSPDLVVEVLSAGNTIGEMSQKRREYFSNGTRVVWQVDPPTRSVAVYTSTADPDATLAGGDVLDGGDVMPGFSLPLATLFRDLDD